MGKITVVGHVGQTLVSGQSPTGAKNCMQVRLRQVLFWSYIQVLVGSGQAVSVHWE